MQSKYTMEDSSIIHRTVICYNEVPCSCSGENIQTTCAVQSRKLYLGTRLHVRIDNYSFLLHHTLLLLLLPFLSLFSLFPFSLLPPVLTPPSSFCVPSTLLFLVHKAKGATPPKELKKLPPAIQPTSEYWGEELVLQTASYS